MRCLVKNRSLPAPISMARAESFFYAWRNSSIRKVVVHASYLINLASPDDMRKA